MSGFRGICGLNSMAYYEAAKVESILVDKVTKVTFPHWNRFVKGDLFELKGPWVLDDLRYRVIEVYTSDAKSISFINYSYSLWKGPQQFDFKPGDVYVVPYVGNENSYSIPPSIYKSI